MNQQSVGEIGNYYGGLKVKQDGDRYYWSIENHDGFEWVEIPKYLYNTLIKYEKARTKEAT